MISIVFILASFLFAAEAEMTNSRELDIDGFWCYSCIDLNANQSWCLGANTLLRQQHALRQMGVVERQLHGALYGVQNCGKWAPYCAIIDIFDASNGARSQYRRECFNGHSYSLTYPDAYVFTLNTTDTRLSSFLPTSTRAPSNTTVCQFSTESRFQVCFTVCSGDFCNGPKYKLSEETDDDGGVRMTGGCGLMWLMLLLLLLLLT